MVRSVSHKNDAEREPIDRCDFHFTLQRLANVATIMIDRLRYAIFFITLSASCLYCCFTTTGNMHWCLLWPALSGIVLASAYGIHRPGWICGKRATGDISLFLLLINFPWLALTWCVWLLTALCSREPKRNIIPGTNITISRYPLFGINLAEYDHILDLTAEFPRFYSPTSRYQCLPNLDGIALCNVYPLPQLHPDEKVLIHCAQGHGRSACFTAQLLASNSLFATADAAYSAIINARPAAKLSPSQRLQVNSFNGY